jgi:hypothetical protein
MHPKEELAQPAGNAKIRGEFDTDAAAAAGPNTNDAVLFPRRQAALLPNELLSNFIRRRHYLHLRYRLGDTLWLCPEQMR